MCKDIYPLHSAVEQSDGETEVRFGNQMHSTVSVE